MIIELSNNRMISTENIMAITKISRQGVNRRIKDFLNGDINEQELLRPKGVVTRNSQHRVPRRSNIMWYRIIKNQVIEKGN